MNQTENSPSSGPLVRRVGRLAGSLGWVGVAAYGGTILLLLLVVVARLAWHIPVGDLTRDPATVAGTHPFVGWLSNVGVLGWCATASICLFTASVLRRRDHRPDTARFLLAAGLFTLLMLIDDQFLLHDEVFPKYLGVSETLWYLFYAVAFAGLIVVFHEQIQRSNYGLLCVSVACLGLSVAFDVVSGFTWVTGLFLLEDGFKLLGIVGWALYFGSVCYRSLAEEG